MNPLLIANWILFLGVVAYALALFTHLIKTRIQFIKLGRKEEFDENVRERLRNIWIYVFGQKKLLKDKKSGIIHVMFFYGFILVQFGAIDLIWKGLKPGSHLTIRASLRIRLRFSKKLSYSRFLVAVVWAFYRRYIEKLVRLKRGWKSGLVLIFIGGLMLSTLLSNGMNMIWQGNGLTWTEPVASSIATIFGFMPDCRRMQVVFFVGLVDSLTHSTNVPHLRAAIKTRTLNCRTCKRIFTVLIMRED